MGIARDLPLDEWAYARAFVAALAFAPIWGAVAGALLTGQFAQGMTPFGAESAIPILVTLALLRTAGPQAALAATAFATTAALHRAGRRMPAREASHRHGAVLLGIAVPVLYGPACLGGLLACTLWMRAIGQPQPLLHDVRDWADVRFGFAVALALGAMSVPVWNYAGPKVVAGSWGLATKLIAAWMVLFGASCVGGPVIEAGMLVVPPAIP